VEMCDENLGLGENFVLVHFDDIGCFEVFDIVVGLDFLVQLARANGCDETRVAHLLHVYIYTCHELYSTHVYLIRVDTLYMQLARNYGCDETRVAHLIHVNTYESTDMRINLEIPDIKESRTVCDAYIPYTCKYI